MSNGAFDGLPDKIDRVEWRMKYQKPLIMTEFGAEAPYGNHGDALTRWFDELEVRSSGPDATHLYGRFVDQAALQGTLTRLGDLGLELSSVHRLQDVE